METLETPIFDHSVPAQKIFRDVGFILLTVMAVAVGLQLLLAKCIPMLTGENVSSQDSSWIKWLATFVPLYLIAVPIGVALFRRIPEESPPKYDLGAKNLAVFLLMCFPMLYGGNIIGSLLSYVLSGGNAVNNLLTYVFDANPLKIVAMVILAPLIEEYVFRKQLIDRTRQYGEKTAIVFSAFVFALFHGNLYQLFYAFGIGLVFAYVYTRTGRLRYSVALHAIINFMGSVVAPWILSFLDLETLSQIDAADMYAFISANEDMALGLLVLGFYISLLAGLSVTGLVMLIIKRKKLIFLPAAAELAPGARIKTIYINIGMILYVLFCLGMIIYALL
jgi:membrane protease YdiL (CAAX protease family)